MRARTKKMLYGLVFSLLFLGVLEIGIRITGLYATQSEKSGTGFLSLYTPTHPGLYNRHTPNDTIRIHNHEFAYPHAIDSNGFRNETVEAKYDVLAFGDSFTEGLGAPQDSSWPALLAMHTGQKVYNAGIMGSDPIYASYMLQKGILPPARRVIFMVNYSDIADVVIRGGQERFGADGQIQYRQQPWFMPVYRYSHLFRAVLHGVFRYDYMFNSPAARPVNIQKALLTLADVLAQTNAYCQTHTMQMMVFVHPVPQEYYMRLDSRLDFREIDGLVALLQEKGVPAFNLRPELEQKFKTPEEWRAVSWPIDGHFNGSGYEALAACVQKHVPVTDTTKVY